MQSISNLLSVLFTSKMLTILVLGGAFISLATPELSYAFGTPAGGVRSISKPVSRTVTLSEAPSRSQRLLHGWTRTSPTSQVSPTASEVSSRFSFAREAARRGQKLSIWE